MLSSARYSGVLNRFYVQENRPVFYGTRHDSVVLAGILVGVFVVAHIVAFLIVRLGKNNRTPLWKLIEGPYIQNNALLIALLLVGWLLGYCAVSWTIWMQFERHERIEPDDYMPVISETAGTCGSMEMASKDSLAVAPTTIVQLPDGDFILGSSSLGVVVGGKKETK